MKQQHNDSFVNSIGQIFTIWAVLWGIFYLFGLYAIITESDSFNVDDLAMAIVVFLICLFGWMITSLVWMAIGGSTTKADLHNELKEIKEQIKKGQ